MRRLGCIAAALMVLGCGNQKWSSPAPTINANAWDERAVRIYKQICPSVLLVELNTGEDDAPNWVMHATAFVVEWGGKRRVVTAGHVAATTGKMRLKTYDGKIVEVIGSYSAVGTDVGEFVVGDIDIAPLAIAEKDPEIGTDVWLVGNPFPKTWYLTTGIVSQYEDDGDLMTQSPVAPGNSGGPLVNEKGEVVGVCSQLWRGWSQFNIFVPTSKVRKFLGG